MTNTDTPDELQFDRERQEREARERHEMILGESTNNRISFEEIFARHGIVKQLTDWSVEIGGKTYGAAEYGALSEHFAGVHRRQQRELPAWMENHILVGFHRGQPEGEVQQLIDSLPARAAELQEMITNDAMRDGYEVADVVVVDTRDGADGITSLDPTVEGPLVNPSPFPWHGKEDREARHNMHRPVIDIDFPAALIPSSTPGHYHLYLDKLMPQPDFENLMCTLGEVGIVEEGYANASVERGYSSVRLPWVKKQPAPASDPNILEGL